MQDHLVHPSKVIDDTFEVVEEVDHLRVRLRLRARVRLRERVRLRAR